MFSQVSMIQDLPRMEATQNFQRNSLISPTTLINVEYIKQLYAVRFVVIWLYHNWQELSRVSDNDLSQAYLEMPCIEPESCMQNMWSSTEFWPHP